MHPSSPAPAARRLSSFAEPYAENLLLGLPNLGSARCARRRPKSGGNQESLASNVHVGYSANLPVGAPGAHKVIASPTPPRRLAGAHGPFLVASDLPYHQPARRNVAPSVLKWTEKQSLGAVAVPSGCSIGAVAVRSCRHRSISAPVRPVLSQFIGAVAVRLYNHSLCTR
jgi:hypothetical protein